MTPHSPISRALVLAAACLIPGGLFAEDLPRFPRVAATSLAGRALDLPADLGSPAALAFVAFTMKQQSEIDAWKAFIDAERAKRPSLRAWELPTIGAGYKFMRGVIEGGMRSGIKSEAARESTVTLFLDAPDFASRIGAGSMGEIAVLVVAPDGRILGRASGAPTAAGQSAIGAALAKAFAGQP